MEKWKIENVKIWWAFFGEDGYLKKCKRQGAYSKHSLDAKRSDLKLFWAFLVSQGFTLNSSLNALTAEVLLLWIEDMSISLNPSTLARRMATVSHFFKVLRDEYNHPLPLKKWPRVNVQRPYLERISDEKIFHILNALQGTDFRSNMERVAFILLISTGMRAGKELVETKQRQIDMENMMIKNCIGKGNKLRDVYFPNSIKNVLQDYINRKNDLAVKSEYLFIYEDGRRLNYEALKRMFKKFGERSHKCRHTFATKLFDDTGDIKLVSEALGHSNTATTDGYIHRTPSEIQSKISKHSIFNKLTQ